MSLSANLSLENQTSRLRHMLKQQQRCDYGMEERCQLLNDPSLIYWWKRMRCQTKVVTDWNTLNDVERPADCNQFCQFL